jgi:predicted amidohydrolase YtcJ
MPGFIDAHAHLFGLGHSLREVDLTGTSTYGEVVARTAARAEKTPKGRFVRGRGWDQNDWPVMEFPHHAELSAATPDHPVLLQRVDGHAALANARALRLAGIDRSTLAPAGGEIVRDAAGDPTGVLIDRAVDLVATRLPEPTVAEDREALALALAACARHGVTALHDAGVGRRQLALLEEEARAGRLTVRIHAMLDAGDAELLEERFVSGPACDPSGFLDVRAIKVYADGALGSRGAWLLADYSDRAGHRGLPLIDAAELTTLATRALEHGFQLCTHAIGDAANRMVLDAYAAAIDASSPRDHRFRIEHAQLLHPSDVARFAKLGVIASVQFCHATSDAPWVPARLGIERTAATAYPWRDLLNAGARLCNGTDAPVEPLSPLRNLAAGITREDPDTRVGSGAEAPSPSFIREQCVTPDEALAAATASGAHAAFRDGDLGRLASGMRADIVLLSADPAFVAAATWKEIRVLATYSAGRRVHSLD